MIANACSWRYDDFSKKPLDPAAGMPYNKIMINEIKNGRDQVIGFVLPYTPAGFCKAMTASGVEAPTDFATFDEAESWVRAECFSSALARHTGGRGARTLRHSR